MLMNLNTPVLSRFQRKASGSIPDSKEWAPLPEVPKLVHSEGPNPVVHCSPLKTWLFGRWKHMSFTVSCYIMLILRRPHGSTKKIAMPMAQSWQKLDKLLAWPQCAKTMHKPLQNLQDIQGGDLPKRETHVCCSHCQLRNCARWV